MINRKTIVTIAKKEFTSYFNSATGYILIVPFILVMFFLFFRTAIITSQASLRPFFDLLPFVLLLFAPAIAMRTFAQEQKNQTLELLFAHPITETEIVLGKFLGSLGFFATLLVSTITLPLTTFIFSNPDPGVVIAQYLGALFVGGAFLAIGIAASALTAAQVSSFLLAAVVSFGFILIGFDMVVLSLPQTIATIVAQMAILPHMNNLSRGVLDLRDLLYFLTLISAFLVIAIIKLSQRKTVENPSQRNALNLALVLVLGIGVVANILMYTYPLRLDITAGRLFTLSTGTKQTLEKLPDVVTISLYTSNNLPGPVQANVQKVRDSLRDYQTVAKGKIVKIERHPDTNTEDKAIASDDGIQQVQFNTLANNAFAVQAGYFGIAIHYGDKKDSIPFIQNTDDLEYQLTRRIRKLTNTNNQSIGIYAGPSQFSQDKAANNLQEVLETQYKVNTLNLDQTTVAIKDQAILVYGFDSPLSATASAKIAEYVKNGGRAVLLLKNHKVNPQVGTATGVNTGLESILNDYGIKINKDIVYDTRLNETITLGGGNVQYLLPYPFWIKALPSDKSFPALSGINAITLAWSNSFDLEAIENVQHVKILQTSPNGGAQTVNFTLSPQQLKPESFNGPHKEMLVAVAATKGDSRIAVVGDSDWVTDQFTRNNPDNLNFASALVDWAAADKALSTVSRKGGDNPVFQFTAPSQVNMVQYGNLLLPPIVIIVYAVWFLQRRRRLTRRTLTLD